jgi:protein ImuB
MLWLAFHLPHLSLQALPWSRPGFETALPVAVIEQRSVIAVNRAAHAQGVRMGMSQAGALALLPSLQPLARDLQREADFVRSLGLALGALTPSICLLGEGVLLEVRASLRLFGGVRALLRRATGIARDCGARFSLGVAPTANGAWLLASSAQARRRALQPRTAERLLDRVPLAALPRIVELAPQRAELLQALGCRSVGELRALPRAGLQRRLGRDLLVALDRCYGQAGDPRIWFAAPERFESRLELLHRADDAASLCHALHGLLLQLQGWLTLHWRAAATLRLSLRHEHGRQAQPDTQLLLQLSTPSRDLAQFELLWRERLQRHTLAAPVYEIALSLDASVDHAGTPGELLPTPGQSQRDHAALIDRLVARLGAQRVHRLALVDDHRPEHAQRCLSPGEEDAPDEVPASPLPRPTWLLSEPQPLASDPHLGRPIHAGQTLRLIGRAERIEAGWFDGALVCRDYHLAEGEDHRLRWVFRERGDTGDAWFLHGVFG